MVLHRELMLLLGHHRLLTVIVSWGLLVIERLLVLVDLDDLVVGMLPILTVVSHYGPIGF